MQTFTTVADLQAALNKTRQKYQDANTPFSLGLVPTMGALHEGHLSLITRAVSENDAVVISIFVNPIQFNNQEDLAKYPRTVDEDLQFITQATAGFENLFVLIPSVDEMYPAGFVKQDYHFGPIEEVMEGPRRPGHFSGVAVVVRRLFDIVNPQRAYFGEKDFQQIAVIRNLMEQIKYPIELVACPIVRADDGLALSSRNKRLSQAARTIAPTIYDTLAQAVEMSEYEDIESVIDWVLSTLASFHEVNPQPDGLRFEPEYFEIVDDRTLQPIEDWGDAEGVVGCIAVWLDGVRLIDMVRFR
ncbi:MAG: pantoate--beta-alanine ligase [Bacteroidales bacterium]|nr:pantoate--beta-alanine ligase [Candidatus Colimorpha onthohippi]